MKISPNRNQSELFNAPIQGPFSTSEEFRKEAKARSNELRFLRKWLEQDTQIGDGEKSQRSWRKRSRAFVIEFAGMPKAGKSSAIKAMRQYFQYADKSIAKFIVDTPAEGVSLRTPGRLNENLAEFNTWAGTYALQELLVARNNEYHDVVILDRGPWDAGCWLNFLQTIEEDHKRRRNYSNSDLKMIKDFFHHAMWSRLADLHIVLVVAPHKALNREKKASLIEPGGATKDTKMMLDMKEIYEREFLLLEQTKKKHCPETGADSAFILDTTNLSSHQVAWKLIDKTLTLLKKKVETREEVQTRKIAVPFISAERLIDNLLKQYQDLVRSNDLNLARQSLLNRYHGESFSPKALNLADRFALKVPEGYKVLSNRGEADAMTRNVIKAIDEIESQSKDPGSGPRDV